MRHSNQRDVIYQVVKDSYDHPTAETIMLRARAIIPTINIATTYRNLNYLVSNNMVQRIFVAEMMNIPIIGLVENMSYFKCPDNGKDYQILK